MAIRSLSIYEELVNDLPNLTKYEPISPEELTAARDSLADATVSAISTIAENRIAGLRDAKNKNVFPPKGIFYPGEFWKLCQKLDPDKGQELKEQEAFDKEYYPKDYFELYSIKPEVEASKALKSLFTETSIGGCNTAIKISFLLALHNYIGKDKFNLLFDQKGLTPLTLKLSPTDIWFKQKILRQDSLGCCEKGGWFGFEGVGNLLGNAQYLNFQSYTLNAVCTKSGSDKTSLPEFTALWGNPESTESHPETAKPLDILIGLEESYRHHKDVTDCLSAEFLERRESTRNELSLKFGKQKAIINRFIEKEADPRKTIQNIVKVFEAMPWGAIRETPFTMPQDVKFHNVELAARIKNAPIEKCEKIVKSFQEARELSYKPYREAARKQQ